MKLNNFGKYNTLNEMIKESEKFNKEVISFIFERDKEAQYTYSEIFYKAMNI